MAEVYHLVDGAASIWDIAKMAGMDPRKIYQRMREDGWEMIGYDADGNETFAPPKNTTLDAAIERLKVG